MTRKYYNYPDLVFSAFFLILFVFLLISSPVLAETYSTDSACWDDVRYEGKDYSTVQIGAQCWMGENLDYDNGCTNKTWVDSTDVGWCGYYDDTDSGEGLLYQWSAAMAGSTSEGAQGICPSGWHIPTDEEWTTLADYVGTDAGDKLKLPEGCYNGNYCDTTGFEGLLAGTRYPGGKFQIRGSYVGFWSSSATDTPYTYFRFLYSENATVNRNYAHHAFGFAVRCLKD